MKRFKTLLLAGIVLALLGLLVVPAAAQPEPGSGDPIVEPNFGGDIATLNPIIVQDGPSNDVIARLFPELLGINPDTAGWEQGADDGMALSWDISEDGRTYTFNLRDDWFWSDGTPVTAQDFLWFYNAVIGGADSPLNSLRDTVESMEAPDDNTLVITFNEADCTALDTLNGFKPVPAHVYGEVFGESYENMADNDYNLNPTVTAGGFNFLNFRPGEQVTLIANQEYPDAKLGFVVPEGWIYRTVLDQVVQMEQFFAGEIDYVDSVPEAFETEVRERAANGEFQTYEGLAVSIRFMAFNLADPTNPLPGLDEEGNPVEQGNHPILGDVRVRQALHYAMDFDAVNQGAFFGSDLPVAAYSRPESWALNEELEPYPYDPEQAAALLDEAGFTDEDGDGVRECHGCLYAEEGTPLAFNVGTNAGNTAQEALYTILQDQWGEVGFDVNVEFLEFNTLVEQLTGQTYDAIGLFWGFSTPDNPNDTRDVFTPTADVPGSGFGVSSYNNPEVTELLEQARTLPGCDQAERAELYKQVQEILHEDVPWMLLSTSVVLQVAQPEIENWNPKPGGSRWNIDSWFQPKP